VVSARFPALTNRRSLWRASSRGSSEKRFFGEPLTVTIQDGLDDDQLRNLLRGPGVVYVRDDDDQLGKM